MDFHAAMETFAEAWVAANTPTAVNSTESHAQSGKQNSDDLPTLLTKDQLALKQRGSVSPQSSPSQPSMPPSQSQTLSPSSLSVSTSSPGATGKSLPIHCIIEQTSGPLTFDPSECGSSTSVELDSYAILPSSTQFCDLVRAALAKLGYSASEAMNAKGAVQIKNWRPLTFDVITDNSKATLDDILGELTQVATLRIRICSQLKLSSTDEVKSKLLQLLLTQSHGLLLSSGCPIEKTLLSSISNGDSLSCLPPDVRRAFDKWYQEQVQKSLKKEDQCVKVEDPPSQPENLSVNNNNIPRDSHISSNGLTNHSPLLTGITGLPNGKTRMRTSFDPEHEIPRLHKWFQESQHPTREQMIRFLDELNSLESRKGRRPLDLTNIIYWFKNARAAHRRASRNYDDSSFEMEESLDSSMEVDRNVPYLPNKPPFQKKESLDSSMEVDRNVPYLPNKNAVYIVPYPYHGPFLSQDSPQDSKEPCDLSQPRKNASSPEIKKENGSCDGDKLSDSAEEDRDSMPETRPEKSPISIKEEKHDMINGECVTQLLNGAKDDVNRSECRAEEKGQEVPHINGIHHRMSDSEEDDEMESDYDDDQSTGECESSQQLNNSLSSSLKREYSPSDITAKDFLGNRLSHIPPSSTAGFHQPLHIPHFPHPFSMHYFPMNTHYLAQQSAAARLHQHQHQQQQHSPSLHPHHKSEGPMGNAHRKRRTRVFIDPMTEIPKLEKWFTEDTHPSSYMIDKFCEELNRSEYRQKFPKLEPKNVQLWFKNHRAKVKRMRISHLDSSISHLDSSNSLLDSSNSHLDSSISHLDSKVDLHVHLHGK